MREMVKTFIRRHHMIQPSSMILVAVSGGPDSMALLHLLKDMQTTYGLTLKVLSVDHQLRGQASLDDYEYVKRICDQWDVEFIGTSVDVSTYQSEYGVGTQVAARHLRYQFFREQMILHDADYLALGHHGDDQAETILMNLTRASSPRALSGIPARRPFAGGSIIRPLLAVAKADIEAYCRAENIVPRRDASNEDTDYTRNDFRERVVPILKEKNPQLHVSVQHLSEALQADDDYLYTQAKTMAEEVVSFSEMRDKAVFKIDRFKMYPIALQRRVYHLILKHLYNDVSDHLSYRHESAFFALLNSTRSNSTIDFPRQLVINKSYEELSFYFKRFEELPEDQLQLGIPGETIWSDGFRFAAVLTNTPAERTQRRFVSPASHLTFPLHIRTRRPGDRMSWEGLNGRRKIKDILIDMKIPRDKRDVWPIIVDGSGRILWLSGLRKDDAGQKDHVEGPYIQIDYFGGDT